MFEASGTSNHVAKQNCDQQDDDRDLLASSFFEASGTPDQPQADNPHGAKHTGNQQDVAHDSTYGSKELTCTAQLVEHFRHILPVRTIFQDVRCSGRVLEPGDRTRGHCCCSRSLVGPRKPSSQANYLPDYFFDASGTSDHHHHGATDNGVDLDRTYGSKELACSAQHVKILA